MIIIKTIFVHKLITPTHKIKYDYFQDKLKYQHEYEISELQAQIELMKSKHESLQSDVKAKEDKIQQLLRETHGLVRFC